jgi:hypothetical protein
VGRIFPQVPLKTVTTQRKDISIASRNRDRSSGGFNTSKGNVLNERLDSAAKAKQAALEKFRARPAYDDPIAVEQRAARLATSVAREARAAERKAERAAADAKLAEEKAAREAEEAREAAEAAIAAEALEAEEAARAIELKVQQKAARDLRYAKRKARR